MDAINNALREARQLPLSKGSMLEYELRIFIDGRKNYPVPCKTLSGTALRDYITDILDKYRDSFLPLEQSINFISKEGVHQRLFINGKQQPTQNNYRKDDVIKDIIFSSTDDWSFKLSVSIEEAVAPIAIDSSNMVRVRLRQPIKIGDWRLDVTLVHMLTNYSNPARLKEVKEKMFTGNFSPDSAAWSTATLYEFELEWIGEGFPTVSSFSIVDEIFPPPNIVHINVTYQMAIYEIAKVLEPRRSKQFQFRGSIKQLGTPVRQLGNAEFAELAPQLTNYFVTDKIDGLRTLIYISGGMIYAVTDTINIIPCKAKIGQCLLDAEKYEDVYYIFDVMQWDNVDLTDEPFVERMKKFKDALELCGQFRLKSFTPLNNPPTAEQFKPKGTEYETDGVVLTQIDGKYSSYVYKYKPKDRLTIDFYIRDCPKELIGVAPYLPREGMKLYILFCGIPNKYYSLLRLTRLPFYSKLFPLFDENDGYFPIQFCPADKHFAHIYYSSDGVLDGKIGEFLYLQPSAEEPRLADWQLQKIRTDRDKDVVDGTYFGNMFQIAENIWFESKAPLDFTDTSGYFQVHQSVLHQESRRFNTHVKYILFERIRERSTVLDIASGKGQDLTKYESRKVSNLYCVEKDQHAINELISRRYKLKFPMNISVKQMDMLAPSAENILSMQDVSLVNSTIDYVVCNFAIHYFLATMRTLENFAAFIAHFTKLNSRFMYTAFDGVAVVKLMNDNEGEWTIKLGDDIKYSIRSQYNSMILDRIGQKISVILPFSRNEYYDEYLVNNDTIISVFAKYGFELESKESFSTYIAGYKGVLDTSDKKYVSLYSSVVLYRSKILGGGVKPKKKTRP